VLLGLIGRLL
jgi:hypothetical protein